jgi:hypothetical protein
MAHRQWGLVVGAALAVACSQDGPLEGLVSDGLTGQGLASVRLLAKAPDDAPLRCRAFEATTDAMGRFVIPAACAEVRYTFSDTRGARVLVGGEGAVVGEAASMTAWWSPPRDGVYLLNKDGASEPVNGGLELRAERKGEVDVRAPVSLPTVSPTWREGAWLVLAPDTAVTVEPLVDAAGWAWVGMESADGVVFTPRAASLDRAKAKSAEVAGRALVYLPYGALPEGRYVLSSGGEVRLLVVGKATGVTGPRPAADAATPPAEPAVTP